MNPSAKRILHILIYIFAAIGFVLVAVYAAVQLGLTKTSGIVDGQHDYFKGQAAAADSRTWASSEEWKVLSQALLKDKDPIYRAAEAAGIQPRLIVAVLIVEQLRLFNSEREVFKQIFAPLKILGNQSQFSWGVMGIKQETAREIEDHLKDPASPLYPGAALEHALDYPSGVDQDSERFHRLTDENDRYYSYLYGALAIREIEAQWQKAGFPLEGRPDVLATLFNIGFSNSHPNADPKSGGAEIDLGQTKYSFGALAQSFYDSSELLSAFPRN